MGDLNYNDVDKLLNQFSETMQIKIMKLRLELSLKVNGYPGASRHISNTQDENNNEYKKILIKLENIYNNELNNLKNQINN